METEKYFDNVTKMYVCGPTVYDSSHIGHARTYITVDLINRIMNITGKNTHLVMNITDIDDKIIKKATERGEDWRQIAKTYEKSFFDSMTKLNVRVPNVIIRVSDVMPQIIDYIQKIIDNGFAYVTDDGSVYFDSNEYVNNGYPFSDLVDEDETVYQSEISPLIILQKRNKKDFALWKGRKSTEVGFDAEFQFSDRQIKSWGRPGWHIECSAMIHETIGHNLDIHFGGIDLKFPHHHNERLQAHAYYHPKFLPNKDFPELKKQWTTTFHHVGHLCIKGCKMSKSLKNFISVDDALQTMTPNQLRWLFVLHKWMEPMDFCDDTMTQAKNFDQMVENFFNRTGNYPFSHNDVVYNEKEIQLSNYFYESQTKIIEKMLEFKLESMALLLSDLVNKTNAYLSADQPNCHIVKKIYDWILALTTSLGFVYQKTQNQETDGLMQVLVETRTSLRALVREKSLPKEFKTKLFQILDHERDVLLPNVGITLSDTKESSSWFVNDKNVGCTN